MARSRKPRDYAAEYARRVRGTQKGSPERQKARGKGAHLRPPGVTEATQRRRKEQDRVREKGGTTSSERQRIKQWFVALAKQTSAAAEAKGREPITRAEIEEAWQDFIRQWGERDWAAFERLRHTVAIWRNEGYSMIHGMGGPVAVRESFFEALEDEFGLQLEENLWFLLWRSGKPPERGERQAA